MKKLHYSHDLKAIRLASKFKTQKDFAAALGVKPSFISQIENSKRPLPNGLAVKITELLEIDLTDLVTYPEIEYYALHGLKIIRKKKGLKQRELARELNISFSLLNKYENLKRPLPKQVATRAAKILEISLEDLLSTPPPEGIDPDPDYSTIVTINDLRLALSALENKGYEEESSIDLKKFMTLVRAISKIDPITIVVLLLCVTVVLLYVWV